MSINVNVYVLANGVR